MSGLSVVIPSRNASNLSACVSAIWENEPDRSGRSGLRIIIVDDGLDHSALHYGFGTHDPVCLPGVRPFIFARACNQGILAAGRDDVIVLNDDAILETPRGFTLLRDQWHRHPEYGVIGPVIPGCGNIAQRPRIDFLYHHREDLHAAILAGHMPLPDGPEMRDAPKMVIFACAFIPRQTIDRVGLLDERFGVNAGGLLDLFGPRGYGCEDGDYCRRVRAKGLKIGVYEPVRVLHGESQTGLSHTFRINHDAKRYAEDSHVHERMFESKWGEKP